MPYSIAGRNAMLGGLAVSHVSLHSAFPTDAGTSEISGGNYARVPITFAAASAGSRAQTGNATVNVPAAATVQYAGLWTALTGGTFLGYVPLGSATPLEFVADLTAETIIAPAHGLSNGQQIVFMGGTPPAPLVEGTIYWVVTATTDTFQVAATSGGAAINLTAQANSACQVQRIVPETFGSAGTLVVSGASLGANF